MSGFKYNWMYFIFEIVMGHVEIMQRCLLAKNDTERQEEATKLNNSGNISQNVCFEYECIFKQNIKKMCHQAISNCQSFL